jgi:excisionase family DNA binding protein
MDTNEEGKIELLTVREVAKVLLVSESHIRDLQHARQLPYIKVGGAIRFEKQDILDYIKRRKTADMF